MKRWIEPRTQYDAGRPMACRSALAPAMTNRRRRSGRRRRATRSSSSATVTSVDHQHVPLAQVPFGQLLQNPRRRLDGLPRDLRLAGDRLVGQRG